MNYKYVPEFIAYFSQTNNYWKKINEGITGSAQGCFNTTKLRSIEISFPKSNKEQQVIVRQLNFLRSETQ